MKNKNHIFALLFGFVFLNFNAQNIQHCGTDEVLKNWLTKNPQIKADFLKRQQEAKKQDSLAFINGYSARTTSAPVYTIPIVFHVLHIGGAENISDAQILDEVNILNRDYRKLNPDTINIFPPFHAANINFEFRLATRDTNGHCTTGITRHYDLNTNWSSAFYTTNEFKYTWSSNKYLNIYIVKSIVGFSYGGYSSFPGTNPSFRDVIVVTNDCIGDIGTSNSSKSRILTHETGHFFNLEHVWGNTAFGSACGDDGVSDTPITKGWNSCPISPSLTAICNPAISENFQNYMDYSNYCVYMFTAGQAARMTTAINSSYRNNLWTNTNLNTAGVINPISPCVPIVDCYSIYNSNLQTYTVCAGESLTLKDASYNGTITSYSWSVTGGGIISAPTSSSTSISFPTIGTQTVTHSVSDVAGFATTTKTVLVLNNTVNYSSSYSESFEAPGLPPHFSIISIEPDVTWAQCSQAAATGTNSYFINGSLDAAGTNPDILETPSYNFFNNPSATFTFKYAYAKYNAANTDVFKVQVSSNCGGSWTDLNLGSNTSLCNGSGGVTTTPFVPTPSQFKLYDLTAHPGFSPFSLESNVKIRFYFKEDTISGYGNNIYIDDINFSTPSGINELTKSIRFNVNPNPSSGEVNINFTLSDESHISYFVTDIIGRSIEPQKYFDLGSGNYTYKINENQKLKPGIYFLNFEINGQRVSRKLVIE